MIHYDKSIAYNNRFEYALITFFKDGSVNFVPVDNEEELLQEFKRITDNIDNYEFECMSAAMRRLYVQPGYFDPQSWSTIKKVEKQS